MSVVGHISMVGQICSAKLLKYALQEFLFLIAATLNTKSQDVHTHFIYHFNNGLTKVQLFILFTTFHENIFV